jgi:carboxymethylenebutenolidase
MALTESVLETADGPMRLQEWRNPGGDRAAVVVFHEMTGVNAHIKDVAGRLGQLGYHAVAPHLFHRTGDQTFAYGDHEPIMEQVGRLDDSHFLADIDATLAHLSAAGWAPQNIGAVGFCIGGRVAFLAAVSRSLGAAVTFYGGGIVTADPAFAQKMPSLLPRAGQLKTPWLGLFGDLDSGIPVEDVERLRAAAAGQPAEVVRYADAGHAFHCDPRPNYVEGAAKDGWRRSIAWLDRHLTRRPA